TWGHVDQGAQVTANTLSVTADTEKVDAEATSLLGDVSVAGGGCAQTATAEVSGAVEAYIGAKQPVPTGQPVRKISATSAQVSSAAAGSSGPDFCLRCGSESGYSGHCAPFAGRRAVAILTASAGREARVSAATILVPCGLL